MNELGIGIHACPLCGGRDFRQHRLGLLRCAQCALVVSPTIWQPQANEAMGEEWFSGDYQVGASSWVRRFEDWNNRRTLARLRAAGAPTGRLLEIGVGSGSMLRAASQAGYAVMGCDLSPDFCERVSRSFGIEMHCGTPATLDPEREFDVIVLNHVVEHVDDPVDFLREVGRRLAPGGVVHVAVPNAGCWEALLSGWTSYEPYHLVYFEPDTLRQTLERSGLAIERLYTQDAFSGWFLAILRTLIGVNRGTGAIRRDPSNAAGRAMGKRSPGIENAYRIAMVLSGAVSWPLRALQGKLGRGDEILAILRKPTCNEIRDGRTTGS